MSRIDDVKTWWRENPQTYGDAHGVPSYEGKSFEEGSPEFFRKLDEEFFSWNKPLHGEKPFDRIFPYAQMKGSKTLEVGCGMGTMAMQWALAGASVHAVDLNEKAIEMTRKRFELFNLSGDIRQSDAHSLPFEDKEFDYIYSWGVLHHSPDIAGSFKELFRTLKPGGSFGIMLYNRNSLLHGLNTVMREKVLHMEGHFLNDLELASHVQDGFEAEGNPHTWPITPREFEEMLHPYSSQFSLKILGTDIDGIFKLWLPALGLFIPAFLKKPWARRWGWSIWAHGKKNNGTD